MPKIGKGCLIKSRRMCSVPLCRSYCSGHISLHKFPFEEKKAKTWKRILKIKKPLSKFMQVCSKHFKKEDFFRMDATTQKNRLKRGAIPSLNIPVLSHQKIKKKKDTSKGKWSHLKSAGNIHLEKNDHFIEPLEKNTKTTAEIPLNIDYNYSSRNEKSTVPAHHGLLINSLCEDKATQTDFGDVFEVPEMFRSDENLGHFTGINHQQLKVLTALSKKLAMEKGILEKNIKLWLILVLCKLKTNLTFDCLGILFGTGNSLCSRMFYSMISILAKSVKPGIHWPTREHVLKNNPKCFNMFPNTRVVLDIIEIVVLRLKCLNCRDLTDSHYKSKHTMKFLIGITPSGVITFVSRAYRGHISEKDIFHHEELLKKLDPYDAVMVGEDLQIEKECEQHFVEVFQPPILRNGNQLSKDEEELAARIAKARVYVETAIEGIKNFAILNEQVDCYTVPYIDDIMTVIAVLVNLTLPINT